MTTNGVCDVRATMVKFWQQQAATKSQSQLLPESVNDEEVEEIISLLPDLAGKDVLELGAGCGRFTACLAERAASVTAVDLISPYIDANKVKNSAKTNVTYLVKDVTDLEIKGDSYDVIFSNWLLMYLGDEEVHEVLGKLLAALRPGGCLFFRESCFHASGNQGHGEFNPTIYRLPATYMNLVESVHQENAVDNEAYGFELILSRSIQAYVKHRGNTNQICWCLQKVKIAKSLNQGFKTFQQFLDNKQYSANGILRYEKIFGRHFVSTGGLETTVDFVNMLDLKAGQTVLDVGGGIGGSAFYMAEKHDVSVLSMDLSSNMVNIGLERANEIKDSRVQFEVSDATRREFAPSSYDVIYSRDTILHISDKKALFASFFDWLKPGGKLLISDYCCSDGEHSDKFKTYVAGRGYHLLSPANYGKVLETVGFVNVKAEDKTSLFQEVLERELKKAESMKDEFVQEFSMEDYRAIVDGWSAKLVRVGEGDQRWGLFYAEKPQ